MVTRVQCTLLFSWLAPPPLQASGSPDMTDRQRLNPKNRAKVRRFFHTYKSFSESFSAIPCFYMLFSFGKTLYLPYFCAAKCAEKHIIARKSADTIRKKQYNLYKNNSMKQTRLLLFSAAVAALLAGCKEKIELDKTDSSMQVSTGIATPIVTIKAPLAEILGIDGTTGRSSEQNWIYAVTRSDKENDRQLSDYNIPVGTLYFKKTYDISRDFHPINIGDFMVPVRDSLNIFDQAAKAMNWSIDGDQTIHAGTPVKFSFPLTVKLDSLNTEDTENRVDEMRISTARFSTVIYTNFGLTDNDIQSVRLKLPKEFTTYKGSKMADVFLPFHVNEPGKLEPDTTFIELNKFLIKLHEYETDRTKRRDNMINEVTFTVEFSLFTTHEITVNKYSAIDYTFNVELLTYEALYGYFNPSTWMRDKDTLVLAEEWPAWKDIKKLTMHFLKPSICLIAEHQIGTEKRDPLHVNLDHIGVATTDSVTGQWVDSAKAEFVEPDKHSYVWKLYDDNKPAITRIDPATDDFKKWAKNEFIVGYTGFGPEMICGNVDKLFEKRPDVIFYDYNITVGEKNDSENAKYSLLRVVNNTKIDLHAVTVIPFILGDNSHVEYNDTADVDFSGVNFDSITNSVEWLNSVDSGTIYLYLKVRNSIPFEVTADYTFIKDNGEPLELPLVGKNKEGRSNRLHISAGKTASDGSATEWGEDEIILRVENEDLKELQSVRRIAFNASVKTIVQNEETGIISTSSELDVTVGVAATIDAVLKLF